MRLRILSLFALLLIFANGCDSTATQTKSTGFVEGGAATVALEVIFNSERETIKVAIPCSADSTVFTILERARNIGDLEFESTGSGATVFVKSIAGVENLGGKGDNWVYKVNEKLGDKSCGVFEVEPGDSVQWSFGKYP